MGVLHHTGAMWQALENSQLPVATGGRLFISIYNDQGRASQYWRIIKRTYNRLPNRLRFLVLWPAFIRLWGRTMVRDVIHGVPFQTWSNYQSSRGMSPWRDVVDWVGGYPFEVAEPQDVVDFYQNRGFALVKSATCGGGHGCNEFVFQRQSASMNY